VELNDISHAIIGAACRVHTALGPGLFEHADQVCLKHELNKTGLKVLSEVGLPVAYDGTTIEIGYRLDLLVEDTVIVELKAVEHVAPIHRVQLLSYLKLSGKPLGLLLNFNVVSLREGITRISIQANPHSVKLLTSVKLRLQKNAALRQPRKRTLLLSNSLTLTAVK
jgi:GxxExxY protein